TNYECLNLQLLLNFFTFSADRVRISSGNDLEMYKFMQEVTPGLNMKLREAQDLLNRYVEDWTSLLSLANILCICIFVPGFVIYYVYNFYKIGFVIESELRRSKLLLLYYPLEILRSSDAIFNYLH